MNFVNLNNRPAKMERAQGMVEFALVLPLLLTMMLAVIEAGRLMFIYSAVYTASREAARYGSAAGNVGGYIAHYQDCNGIRSAAMRVGSLAGLQNNNITIVYDQGTSGTQLGTCPVGGTGPSLSLGNRVTVQVLAQYRPLIPILRFPGFPISSTSSRTILKNVSIQGENAGSGSSLPHVYFEEDLNSHEEGDAGESYVYSLNVELSESSEQNVSVNFSIFGSAAQGVDYTINRTSPLIIPAGQTHTTVNITILGDGIDEYDETIGLTIDSVVNALRSTPYVHTTTILDDDDQPVVTFATSNQTVSEGSPNLVVEAYLRDAGGNATVSGKDVSVPLTMDGAATPALDYVAPGIPLVINPGNSSGSLTVSIQDDILYEGSEILAIHMGAPVNAALGPISNQVFTIIDNDAPPLASFTTTSQVVAEASSVVTVTVELKDAAGFPVGCGLPVNVWYSIDGTATSGSSDDPTTDYTISGGPLVIPPGSTRENITISLVSDELPELEETIILHLINTTNATLGTPTEHTVTITSDPLVQFELEEMQVQEGAGWTPLQVNLTPAQETTISVPFTVQGSAVSGTDYLFEYDGVITIPAGATSANLRANILEDLLSEYNENLVITLGTPVGAVLGTPHILALTIIDNDPFPTVRFSSPGQAVDETLTTVSFQVLLNVESARPITVPLSLTGTAIHYNDYTITPATQVVIPPGSLSANINVQILDDSLQEPAETIVVGMNQPQNAVPGTPASHVVTINVNDQPVCDIFTGNELMINGSAKEVAWTLSNLGQDTLLLKSATVIWPTNAPNAPKFDLVKVNGQLVWDDNKPQSPSTAEAPWIGFDSYRLLSQLPTNFELYFTRSLLSGDYQVSFVFYNVTRGIDCTPVEKSGNLP